ncbi:MAG: TonB-dependent receptor [Nitrospiraceae bacterium]|nr:TonB-dependent receptor [Nitrospiraceae bacterium]
MKKVLVGAVIVLCSAFLSQAGAEEQNHQLGDVVVTATKTERESRDVTQSVTVLTGESIRKSSATTVAQALEQAVGMTVTDFGPAGAMATASIRGARYSQVLVMVDGVRMNSPRDGGVDLSALPVTLADIDRIEIVRGPSSALYGADAMGGVINIITKQPQYSSSRLGGSIGSHGYDTIQAAAAGRQGDTSYSVTGTRETSDGYRQNSDLEQWITNGRAGYAFSKDASVDVTANYISKDNGVPGSLEFPSPAARQFERELVLGANYRQKLSADWDVKASASQTTDELRYADPAFMIDTKHRSTTDRGEAQATWLVNSWNLATVGYEQRNDSLNSTDSGEHSTTIQSAFAQDEITVFESLIVVAGARYDSHSVYGDRTSPRVSGRYLIGKGTIIRASYGESFRGPTFNDLYWSDPYGNTGNPNLKPEVARETEAGIEQDFGGGSSVKVTGFERKVENLIDWQEYAPFQYMPVNIGKANIKGLEAEAGLRMFDSLGLFVNYTYMDPVDEVTGQKIYYTIPRNQVKGRLQIGLDNKTTLSLEGRMVDNYVKPGDYAWKYSVYDAKLSSRFGKPGQGGEIYFAMMNLFDRTYDLVRFGGTYPAPPREIRGGVMIPF